MRAQLKRIAHWCAILLVSPLIGIHFLSRTCGLANISLQFHAELLANLPGLPGSYLRVAFYRFALKLCHPTATISWGTLLSKEEAEIHQNVYIGPSCHIGLVTLESDVLVGPAVQIPSGKQTHGTASLVSPIRNQAGVAERVTIGRDSWIGGGAIILADVLPQTVVGAGSIVTKSMPAQSIVAGNPARLIRSRMPQSEPANEPLDRHVKESGSQ